jgi:hypothetical protein
VTTRVIDPGAVVAAAVAAGIGNGRGAPSTRAIALSTGVAPSSLARAMDGRAMSVDNLLRLAEALRVPVETLLSVPSAGRE